jgi:hypothetical protein
MSSPPKKPTKALLAQREELEERRKAATRDAAAIAREVRTIDLQIEAFVRETEPKSLLVRMLGWVFRVTQKPKAVRWKDELVARLGADEARAIEDAAPMADAFVVERDPK